MLNDLKYLVILVVCLGSFPARAQDNYEIQVYGSETVSRDATMVELHSNFTFGGQLRTTDGTFPTHHMEHETVEITHGFTPNFETGFYLFTAGGDDGRAAIVGSHIRPRVRVPEAWHVPVGFSLSMEFGYQSPKFCPDDWTLEVRSILDKTWRKWYFAINPTFDKAFHGADENQGLVFSPNLKFSYAVTKKIASGVEYYGSVGRLNSLLPYQQQQHQLFLAVDLELGEDWEFNAGYGLGFTAATDNEILKLILGYKLHKHAHCRK